ncbi:hypothetical protein [Saccharopolyspora rosea]|uniref:Uncharacterized protein n=1 Tax=Saccharopolyspora rosea TaxID=524884 RepID=A0ABW3FTM7_9PSEU|nr:hypothetical protein [Saccharopolyspora rosea]
MTLSEDFAPQAPSGSLVQVELDIPVPTQDRTEPAFDTDRDEFDESHLIRGYD